MSCRYCEHRCAPPVSGHGVLPALTAAERKVAELVTAGRTNAEIGRMLFVSRRTVEAHLSSAYRKLGIGSRVQLAAILAAALAPTG